MALDRYCFALSVNAVKHFFRGKQPQQSNVILRERWNATALHATEGSPLWVEGRKELYGRPIRVERSTMASQLFYKLRRTSEILRSGALLRNGIPPSG